MIIGPEEQKVLDVLPTEPNVITIPDLTKKLKTFTTGKTEHVITRLQKKGLVRNRPLTREERKVGYLLTKKRKGYFRALGMALIIACISHTNANPDWFYQSLDVSTNLTDADALDNILHEYNYGHDYERNVWDCSDFSILCQSYLKTHDYKNVIAMRNDMDDPNPHMWIAVQFPDGWMFVETTTRPLQSLGEIVWGKNTDEYSTGIVVADPLLYSAALDGIHTHQSYSLEELKPN